jgi:two-component system LytT family sensor kinase
MKRIVVIGLHVCYWLMYVLMVLLFEGVVFRLMHFSIRGLFRALFLPGSFFICPAILGFYGFYFCVFPLLRKKRFLRLGLAAFAVSIGSAITTLAIMRLVAGPRVQLTLTLDTGLQGMVLAFIAFLNGIMALIITGFTNWYRDIRIKEELKRRHSEMELALIKSQLSPHFLFNTLNNIDVLIEKDAARASSYLNKLSDILRFMLYETKTERIPIDEDLRYIGKYIDLQRIRTARPDSIHYSVAGEAGQWMVEPLLFLPFIENAFKHAERRAEDAISIRFQLDGEKVVFECVNRYSRKPVAATEASSGLGDGLIRKRLNLLYPGRHSLEVSTAGDMYKATLILHAN